MPLLNILRNRDLTILCSKEHTQLVRSEISNYFSSDTHLTMSHRTTVPKGVEYRLRGYDIVKRETIVPFILSPRTINIEGANTDLIHARTTSLGVVAITMSGEIFWSPKFRDMESNTDLRITVAALTGEIQLIPNNPTLPDSVPSPPLKPVFCAYANRLSEHYACVSWDGSLMVYSDEWRVYCASEYGKVRVVLPCVKNDAYLVLTDRNGGTALWRIIMSWSWSCLVSESVVDMEGVVVAYAGVGVEVVSRVKGAVK